MSSGEKRAVDGSTALFSVIKIGKDYLVQP